MIYTTEWAWLHIPKTAGINFRERVGYEPGVTIADINISNAIACGENHFNHQPLQWWLDNGTLNLSQFIFTFVRNPYARIVSLYNHMATSGNNPNLSPFKKFIMEDIDKGLRGGIVDKRVKFDFAWPQYKYLENDQSIQVKFYKMESELQQVEELVKYIFTDTRINEKPHPPWETYYDSDSREKVEDFYMEDFKRFNYGLL